MDYLGGAAIAAAGRVIAAGGCALALALGLLVWVLRREIAQPLKELRRAADTIRAGRLAAPVRKRRFITLPHRNWPGLPVR